MRRSAPGFRAYRGARQLLALVLPALALMLAARPSHAVEYTQVKTVEGCKVVEVRGYAAAYQQISWSGSCRNGLAEGTGKLVHTWKDGRVNTAWETLQAGRRPFETSDVYSYLENAKTYIHFKQAGQPAVKITEAECLAAPGCWTIAKARGQTNGTSAPKTASAPLSGAAVAVSSGTSAMGIEFRFENRQGSPMIVGTGGPCATSDLGLYRVEASPASLMAREKGGRSIFLETPRFTVIGEAAPGVPIDYIWNEFTARDIQAMLRAAAANQSTPQARKNYQQMQCVARNHVQYEQAIYGWFKANWKSCPQRCQVGSAFHAGRHALAGTAQLRLPLAAPLVQVTRAGADSSARSRRRRVRQIGHHRGLARRGRLVLAAIAPFGIIGAAHVAAVGIEQRDDPCELARHQLPDLQGRARAWAEFV